MQECVYMILDMELSKESRDCKFINTSTSKERERYLKSKEELEEIRNTNPDSTDKFKDDNIEHYSVRPDDEFFSQMCHATHDITKMKL